MEAKKKVLFIRKPDKTMHMVELSNKPTLEAQNSRLPAGKKWKFEVMDEEKAIALLKDGPIDKNYVTEAEAKAKVISLEQSNADKDKEIEELKAQLAGKSGKAADDTNGGGGNGSSIPPAPEKAADLIEKINQAKTVEEVKTIWGDDKRTTVVKAAKEKIEELEVV
jgi:hypothetical protein